MAEKKTQFGVYQQEFGSFTHGDVRFTPGRAVEVAPEVAAAANPEVSPETPVRFFPTVEKANEEVSRLKEKFARKPKG
jgi:5,10-methylenetetrahydrofolate reductase